MATTWSSQEGSLYTVKSTFASVAADTTSARQEIDVATFGGSIVQVQFSTANVVESNFSLFQHATSLSGSVDEIYRIVGLTQFWHKENHNIRFLNQDTPQVTKLYIEITNQSLVAPTGTNTLLLWLARQGSRGA